MEYLTVPYFIVGLTYALLIFKGARFFSSPAHTALLASCAVVLWPAYGYFALKELISNEGEN